MNNARRDEEWLRANRPSQAPATYDHINPSHYKGDRKYEPMDVIEDWGLNYHLGNALKYIARNGRKPGEDPRQGLSKAIWYLERLQDKYLEDQRTARDADELLSQKKASYMVDMTLAADFIPFDASDWTWDEDEAEFEALGDKARINDIPASVIPGSDADSYRWDPGADSDGSFKFVHTYDDRYRKAAGLDGIGGATHEDIIVFENYNDEDPWRHLPDH